MAVVSKFIVKKQSNSYTNIPCVRNASLASRTSYREVSKHFEIKHKMLFMYLNLTFFKSVDPSWERIISINLSICNSKKMALDAVTRLRVVLLEDHVNEVDICF